MPQTADRSRLERIRSSEATKINSRMRCITPTISVLPLYSARSVASLLLVLGWLYSITVLDFANALHLRIALRFQLSYRL